MGKGVLTMRIRLHLAMTTNKMSLSLHRMLAIFAIGSGLR
jgi:hypothetical protein